MRPSYQRGSCNWGRNARTARSSVCRLFDQYSNRGETIVAQATIESLNGKNSGKTEGKRGLPVIGGKQDAGIDVEAELARFEIEERARLGLDQGTDQWIETMANAQFTAAERPKITLLIA